MQHFLLSSRARTLSLATVFRMSDAEAEAEFRKIRWEQTDGAAVCPHCGGLDAYECRRPNGSLRFRCSACVKDFTITSGTLFGYVKKPLRTYLAAIAIFCNEVKGKSMLALSRDLGVWYKTAFVLAHKLREAMAAEMKGRLLGGDDIVAEADGGYFGGYSKPANEKKNRRDRRLAQNQTGKRRVVVVIRERGGGSLPAVFNSESEGRNFIRKHLRPGTTLHVDEATSWDGLEGRYDVKRINHSDAYSYDGCCTNWAEEFFSRMRRAEQGHHHHIAGPYLYRYAQEMAWREDNRRMDNKGQVQKVARLALTNKPSVDFTGYWQRRKIVAS